MKRAGILFVGLVALFAAAGCDKRAANPTEASTNRAPVSADDGLPKKAQPKLPTVKLWLGAEELEAEVAMTNEQIMTGMMWRTNMPEGTAMLFVHPVPHPAGYWMKNCFIPLSVAYLDTEGVILEIHDMQPQDTNTVLSAATNVRFAIETPQGWFQRHNIRPGALVRTEKGSLAETFLRSP